MAKAKTERWVLVTTTHRGVFFGRLAEIGKDSIRLDDAQNCLYWGKTVKGFLGLASHGPDATCRVTRPAPKLQLFGVTSVSECSDASLAAWKICPWS